MKDKGEEIKIPTIKIRPEEIFNDGITIASLTRTKISKFVENKENEITFFHNVYSFLNDRKDLFDDNKVKDFIKTSIFQSDSISEEDFSQKEIFYRKVIEDLLNEYVLNNKATLPSFFNINGDFEEDHNHLSLIDIVKLASFYEEGIDYDSLSIDADKFDAVVKISNILLYAIKKRCQNDNEKPLLNDKALEIISSFNDLFKKNAKTPYFSNEGVKALNSDIEKKNLQVRYLINGPIIMGHEDNKKTKVKDESDRYSKDIIKILNVAVRMKGIKTMILNSLGGKEHVADAIGLRIVTRSFIDVYNFHRKYDSKISGDRDIITNQSLISFDDPSSFNFQKRMDDLLELERIFEFNWKSLIDPSDVDYVSSTSKGGSIKSLLEYILDQKNQLFIHYLQYENMVDQYYGLLNDASVEKASRNDKKYNEIIKDADILNKRIISYRKNILEAKESTYHGELEYIRSILVIGDSYINKNPLVGHDKNMKLHSNTKECLKFFVDTLAIDKGSIDISFQTGRLENRKPYHGNPFYVTNKMQLDLKDGVKAEIVVLPAWFLGLIEIISPHEGYAKQKVNKFGSEFKKLLDTLKK